MPIEFRDCFYTPGKPGIIDAVHPGTGRGAYSGETLTETRERYPGAALGNFDEVIDAQDGYWRSPPVEITAERFEEMLCILPPEGWVNGGRWEVFKLMEYTAGDITAIFCRIGGRYFEMQDRYDMASDLIVEKCRDTL